MKYHYTQEWLDLSPFEKQKYFMQYTKQMDKDGNMLVKNIDYLNYIQEESLEYGFGMIANNKPDMLDGLADICVTVAGADNQFKVGRQEEYHFNFHIGDKNILREVHRLQDVKTRKDYNYLKVLLPQIWISAVYIAKQNNFDIEGAFNEVMRNNIDKLEIDKDGNVVLQEAFLPDGTPNPKVGKAVKIDNYPKPNLEPFIL